MGRPRNPFPVPSLRKRGLSWQIRWRDGEKRYAATIGPVEDGLAKALCALASAALTGKGEWPEELATHQEVRRYLRDKLGDTENSAQASSDAEWIERYVKRLRTNAISETSTWPTTARSFLQRWLAFVGDINQATPGNTLNWLDSLTKRAAVKGGKRGERSDEGKPVSSATRNRARAALSGFIAWMKAIKQLPKGVGLLDGIKAVREVRPPDLITVWDKEQIPGLLAAADKRPDGIAVWVGILAGLRRSEIARLEWDHIGAAIIGIYTSKTTLARQVPLSSVLAKRLDREPRKNKRVVGRWPETYNGWDAAADEMIETHLPKLFPPPAGVIYPPRQYGWNTLRHTFASRHVQAGVPLDVVAGWIGDTIQTCRKHYARFVPRDRRDDRIDQADPVIPE